MCVFVEVMRMLLQSSFSTFHLNGNIWDHFSVSLGCVTNVILSFHSNSRHSLGADEVLAVNDSYTCEDGRRLALM